MYTNLDLFYCCCFVLLQYFSYINVILFCTCCCLIIMKIFSGDSTVVSKDMTNKTTELDEITNSLSTLTLDNKTEISPVDAKTEIPIVDNKTMPPLVDNKTTDL